LSLEKIKDIFRTSSGEIKSAAEKEKQRRSDY